VLGSEVVAVFNFAQRDDDPKYAWLSKGLTDLLINQLSDLPEVTVVSRDRMQSLVSEYQRLASKPQMALYADAAPVAKMLEAKRMVFGSYAVTGESVTLTAQVIDITDERVLFETRADGTYKQVLDAERDLARRLRAYFLGQPVEKVPLGDVPQWTTSIGAAEHLYAGVDLFDRGRFAEAWLEFRQASRLDPAYADAIYWRGRMFYYLMLYENARPILDGFFGRWPLHPRAGDAAIEVLDSYRQTVDDAATLRDIYRRLRETVDPQTVVHNKSMPGMETQTLLRTYIGGFLVQAERALGNLDAAADLALELQRESRQAFDDSDIDSRHWGFFDGLARFTAMERRMADGKIRLNPKMFNPDWSGLTVWQLKPHETWYKRRGGRGWKPIMIRQGDKYRMRGVRYWERWFVAPDGYEFASAKVSGTFHHEPDSAPFMLTTLMGSWTSCHQSKYVGRTDRGTGEVELELPHRCRAFSASPNIAPPSYGAWGGLELLVNEPTRDYLESVQVTVKLRPLTEGGGCVRVVFENAEKARVLLDGRLALMSEGTIHGVAPGEHTVLARPARGVSRNPSAIFDPVEQTVTVRAGETAECRFRFPFTSLRATTGWSSPTMVARDYPTAKLPPATGEPEPTRPCLIRVDRGPLYGRLVALWSFREELWLSYSSDDGHAWMPPVRLPIPVNSAHQELAPQLLQDEQGRFCLVFISDRNIDRAFYPYLACSWDLERWQAPRKLTDLVCDSLCFRQDQRGRYLLLIPPPFRGENWTMRLERVGDHEWREQKVDVVSAFGKKYARKRFALLASTDLQSWAEVPTDLGTDGVREVDFLQTADGRFHAVYTQVTMERARDSIWETTYQSSDDLLHWSEPRKLISATWIYRTPSLATDGKRVYGSISISGNNTHWFEIGEPDVVGWWGFASQRNVVYHDPPAFGNRLHWLWLAYESPDEYYEPGAGKVFHSWRPSDRGEWLFRAPEHRPPDSPYEARQKQRVLRLADASDSPPGRLWTNLTNHTNDAKGYRFTVPADWTGMSDPRGMCDGFLAPESYGFVQPSFEVMVFDAKGTDDVKDLAAMAERRWTNMDGKHIVITYPDHPCKAKCYLIVYEVQWGDATMIAKQYGFFAAGKEYRVGVRCPVEATDEWMPVLNRMLESFRLVPSEPQ